MTANPVLEWNEALLAAVRLGPPAPTITARALNIVHTAMYDAWSAYDANALATQIDIKRPHAEYSEANKIEALSYAAYRTALEVFPLSAQRAVIEQHFASLG